MQHSKIDQKAKAKLEYYTLFGSPEKDEQGNYNYYPTENKAKSNLAIKEPSLDPRPNKQNKYESDDRNKVYYPHK